MFPWEEVYRLEDQRRVMDSLALWMGEFFAMAKGAANQHNYISFIVKSKSYLRIFVAVDDKNSK
jgi:hypothetical protein